MNNYDIVHIGLFCSLFKENNETTFIGINDKWMRVIPFEQVIYHDRRYRYIYIQVNEIDKMYYIGKSSKLSYKGSKEYKGSGTLFKSKFKKHFANFTKYIIYTTTNDSDLLSKEKELVTQNIIFQEQLYNNNRICLNLIEGGAISQVISTQSERHKNAILKIKRHHNTKEFKNKMSAIIKNKFKDQVFYEKFLQSIQKLNNEENNKKRSFVRKKYIKESPEEYNRLKKMLIQHNETLKKYVYIKDNLLQHSNWLFFDSYSSAARYIKDTRNAKMSSQKIAYNISLCLNPNATRHTVYNFSISFTSLLTP